MIPVSDSVVLVCAVLASMAFGVLVAYGVCEAVFGLLRTRTRQTPVESELRVTVPAGVIEG